MWEGSLEGVGTLSGHCVKATWRVLDGCLEGVVRLLRGCVRAL